MARVLIVEDSPGMRAFLRASLEGGAFEVVEAESCLDAMRLLPRSRYDVVVADIHMPAIHGLELVRFIRASEHHRDVAIVLISTQSSPRDRDRGLALGATAFLAKPFSAETFRAEVARHLAAGAAEEP